MAPFVNGTSALKSLPYDPIAFKRVRFTSGNCGFHVYRDEYGNTLFELRYEDSPVMAFLYHRLPVWALKQRRDAFSRLFTATATGELTLHINVLATQQVSVLPYFPMWDIGEAMGENLFWASNRLRLNVHPSGPRDTAIEILSEDGKILAHFGITGVASDEEESLDAALALRKTLRLEPKIRVESLLDLEKVVWFIPHKPKDTL